MLIFQLDSHDCVPSYVKRTKQPFTGGTYRPLSNNEDAHTRVPSNFKTHHSSTLYTQKSTIHTDSSSTSIFIPNASALLRPVETATAAIVDKVANNSDQIVPFPETQLDHSTDRISNQAVRFCKKATQATAKTLSAAGHTIADTVQNAGRTVHSVTETIKRAWYTFVNSKAIQLIIKFFSKAHALWKKRMKFSYAFYTVVFALLTSAEVIFLQWGVYSEPEYAEDTEIDQTTRILQSVAGQVTKFVSQMWLEQKYQFLLNFIGIGLIYLVLILVLNRFWIATVIFGVAMTAYGVANSIKMRLRNEPILPSDLSFILNGNSGSLLSFIPKDQQTLVSGTITVLAWFSCICVLFFILDGRRRFIHCSWKQPFSSAKNVAGTLTRIIAAVLSIALLASYTCNLNIPGAWSYVLATNLGYKPVPWNTYEDATSNGPATTFESLVRVKAMEKPEGYSQKNMESIAQRYAKEADNINSSRTNNLTDSTVIMILSESFSDPTRVPGVSFSIDPMPNIRSIKDSTTSGLMLSPGYGGGTANIEYQSLTGMSLASFNDQLISPYQQLVPNMKSAYSFNQIWNEACHSTCSVAYHPYYKSFYLRDSNYKKFGFKFFRTLDSSPMISHQDHIDNSIYVSDAASYQNVLDYLQQSTDQSQFIQLVTMQNHLPYSDWYVDNEFKDADISSDINDVERQQIDTYAKGVSHTDSATINFLNQLNELQKPTTVIFYGDHLPGIYQTAAMEKRNQLALHESDYFIWSNAASSSSETKLSPEESNYSSSNYFIASAAEHMNAKVSPFLALLTELHEEVPSMGRFASTNDSWGSGSATYLNSDGSIVKKKNLSQKARQLLKDYSLVQYDMTSGKNYLQNLNFTQISE
mgnify:FL=1